MKTRSALGVVLAFAVSPAFAATHEVGPPGSGYPFSSIQAAIDAAAPGDVVLVHAGTYSEFSLSKPLRVIGDGPGAVIVQSSSTSGPFLCLRVHSIPAGTEALVSGLTLIGNGPIYGSLASAVPLAVIEQNAGAVALHDIATEPSFASPALSITDSAWVHVLDASIRSFAYPFYVHTGDGIVATNSTLWMARSVVEPFFATSAGMATDGLRALDSVVYVADSRIVGGTGLVFTGPACGTLFGTVFDKYGGVGGDALEARGSSIVKLVGGAPNFASNALIGGAGGQGECSGGPNGPAIRALDSAAVLASASLPLFGTGPTSIAAGAAFYAVPTVYPTIHLAPTAALTGSPVTLHLSGNAGSPAIVFLSGAFAGPLLFPGIDGAVALDPASASVLGGALLDPLGLASLGLAVPPSPSLVGAVAHLQALELGPTQMALSNPALLVVKG